MPSLLHVTNGESAGDTLRQTALGGAVLAWQDALHGVDRRVGGTHVRPDTAWRWDADELRLVQ